MIVCRTAVAASLLMASATMVGAQSPDLEPGVQTSPSSPATAPQPQPQVQATPSAAAPAAQPPKPAATAAAAAAARPGAKSQDRIELDTTQISGNRELPKVMYVVPWRKADPGEFAGRPPNSLLDEALTPVDRDVFRRQNRYYAALEAGSAGAGAPASQSSASGAKVGASESKDEK